MVINDSNITLRSDHFKHFLSFFSDFAHSSELLLNFFEEFLDVRFDVLADLNPATDGPIPEQVGKGLEAFILFLAHLFAFCSHALASIVQPENHDIAGNHIHLLHSFQHVLQLLSSWQFAFVGEQVDIPLNTIALDVMKFAEDVLDLI